MALPFSELEAITNDYFIADDKKAVDIFFQTSFFLNQFMLNQIGLWKRPEGGRRFRVPLEYDGQESGFYGRGDTISSDDRESLNAAVFDPKHVFGNATILRVDELANAGKYAEVQLVVQRLAGAQKSTTNTLAGSVYDAPSGDANRLTGLLALCNETATLAYGDIAEDELIAADGTKPWEGKVTTTTEGLTLNVLRAMVTAAKIRDGMGGKIDNFFSTEALYNVVQDLMLVQQRFTQEKPKVEAGFTVLVFEGKNFVADDFCPSGYVFGINSMTVGFAIYRDGFFQRSPWRHIPDSPDDRSMKIYWDGNLVCSNRKGNIAHSNLS